MPSEDDGQLSSEPIDDLQQISLEASRRLVGTDWSAAGRFLGDAIDTENDGVQPRALKEAAEILKDADGTYAPEIVQAQNTGEETPDVYQTLLVFVNVDNPDDFIAVCPSWPEDDL